MQRRFIPALTGIRSICMYGIFFKHMDVSYKQSHPDLWLFVNQFFCFLNPLFVLSGFVIYYTYSEIASLEKKILRKFFVNRIARIFPILLILVTATYLLAYRSNLYPPGEMLKQYLMSISLVKGYSKEYFLTGIPASWTLTLEWTFYLLAPFIFILVRKRYGFAYFLLAAYSVLAVLTLLYSGNQSGDRQAGWHFSSQITFFGRCFEFATGIYLAMVLQGKVSSAWLFRNRRSTLWIGSFIFILSLVLEYMIAQYYGIEHGLDTMPGLLVNHLLVPAGVFFFFYSLAHQNSLIQRLLSTRLMTELGNSTYSFYLLQTSFVFSILHSKVSSNTFILLCLLIIVAYLFHRIVEQPLDILVKKWLNNGKRSPVIQPEKSAGK